MQMKLFLKIVLGIVALLFILIISTTIFLDPWAGKKIHTALNTDSSDYRVEIEKVHISIIRPGIKLETITVFSKIEQGGSPVLKGEIALVKLKGIKLAKAIFKHDIDIGEAIVSDISMTGKIPFPEKKGPPKISPYTIRIDKLFFDKIHLEINSISTAQSYVVKDGILKVYDLQVEKMDTLSADIIKQFDFDAIEFHTVSPDSMYTNTAIGINYSATSKILAVDSFSIHPNYKDYDFTSRHEFETDRFEAGISAVFVHDFDAARYFRSKSLVSSYIEIGKLDMQAFRDKRKEFRHVKRPAFQDVIYSYPGALRIDSVGILNGNITYTEHVDEADEPGRVSFHQVHIKAYKITNDTIYKTEKASLELKCDALLMGKGRMTFLLKAGLFDSQNTFTANGALTEMEISELNPMLEKNAFVYATSGTIDGMNFSFTANNTKATGKLKMLYHGLDLAVKNKQTNDTTAIKERIISLLANIKVKDSNPMPGEEVREGIIAYERDPEKFLFNYCVKSLFSGIKTSIVKTQAIRKKEIARQEKGKKEIARDKNRAAKKANK